MYDSDALLFVKVAQLKSFTKAAQFLKIPKATLSRRISSLEEQLGVRLLERTTRSIHLTDVGTGYLAHCERIVEEIQEAQNYIAGARAEPKGTLRISVAVDIGTNYFSELFVDFMKLYPGLSVEVDLSQRMVNLLEEGVDVAIRVGQLLDSSLIARKIGEVPLGLYAHPDFYSPREIPKNPEQLNPKDCIGLNHRNNHWSFTKDKKEIKITPKHRYKVNSLTLVQKAVMKKLGIALLPESVCKPYLGSQLIPLLAEYRKPTANIYAVYPSKKNISLKLSRFLDFLNEQMKNDSSSTDV